MPSWICLHVTRPAVRFDRVALAALVLIAVLSGAGPVRAQTPATDSAPALSDGSFERDGVRLYFRTQGAGEPLVLLSGGPGIDVDYLFPLGELLPKTYRLIYLEQRGTGRSLVAAPSRSTVNLDEAIDDVEGLRRHLQVEQLLVVGHSYGGMLAMAYGAKYPTRVERLILIASGGPTMRFAAYFGANIRARLRHEEREEQKYWDGEVAAGRVSKQTGANKVQAVATPAYFFDRAKGLAFVRAAPPEPVNILTNELIQQDFEKYDLRDGLSRLAAPVLLVQGHQDPIGDLTAEDIRSSIKNVTVQYLNECGHFPWLEQPDAFRKAVGEFLAHGPADR